PLEPVQAAVHRLELVAGVVFGLALVVTGVAGAIADLAEAASLSPSQFTRQFRASTGRSPHQFLLALRLERACRLLRAGTDPIAEVAVACGFSHQEHLTRVMRARLGTTPAALRRSG
ncbi:helix-turn-helix domain-containing protein, partial [Streptomyces sp. NPDC004457]